MKVGIAGARGLSTILGFRACPGVEIEALCDLDEELLKKMSAEFGIPKTYRVFEDMLESDIDAVVIATPMQCHVPQAILALEAGKHILSEVTAGVTMDELWWLTESVEKSGKIYMYAENYCYMPEVQIVRAMALEGLFGEIYYGEGEYLHNLESILNYPNGKTSWRSYWQCGKRGCFYPTHSLGPVMECLPGDRVVSVSTFSGGSHNSRGLRQDDTTVTMCRLESGGLIQLRLDCLSARPHNLDYYQIQGTKGVYEAARGLGDRAKVALRSQDDPESFLKWRPLDDFAHMLPERYKNATPEQKKAGHSGGDFFLVHDFVSAVENNTQPQIDVYKACEWTAVGLLSELSVVNGGRTMELAHFRKNMPDSEKIIKL